MNWLKYADFKPLQYTPNPVQLPSLHVTSLDPIVVKPWAHSYKHFWPCKGFALHSGGEMSPLSGFCKGGHSRTKGKHFFMW